MGSALRNRGPVRGSLICYRVPRYSTNVLIDRAAGAREGRLILAMELENGSFFAFFRYPGWRFDLIGKEKQTGN